MDNGINERLTYPGAGFFYQSAAPAEVFTPEDLSDEHLLIARTAKRFLETEIRPNNEKLEQQDFGLVRSLMEKAGELGLLAHSVPEKYGGLGLDKISK